MHTQHRKLSLLIGCMVVFTRGLGAGAPALVLPSSGRYALFYYCRPSQMLNPPKSYFPEDFRIITSS
jgi:hypothetical protein